MFFTFRFIILINTPTQIIYYFLIKRKALWILVRKYLYFTIKKLFLSKMCRDKISYIPSKSNSAKTYHTEGNFHVQQKSTFSYGFENLYNFDINLGDYFYSKFYSIRTANRKYYVQVAINKYQSVNMHYYQIQRHQLTRQFLNRESPLHLMISLHH